MARAVAGRGLRREEGRGGGEEAAGLGGLGGGDGGREGGADEGGAEADEGLAEALGGARGAGFEAAPPDLRGGGGGAGAEGVGAGLHGVGPPLEEALRGAQREGVLAGAERLAGGEAERPRAGDGVRRRVGGLEGRVGGLAAAAAPRGGPLEVGDAPAEGLVGGDAGRGIGGHHHDAPGVHHGAVGQEGEAAAEHRGLEAGGGGLPRGPGGGGGDGGLDAAEALGHGGPDAAGECEVAEGSETLLRLGPLRADGGEAEGGERHGLENDQRRQDGGDSCVPRNPRPPRPHLDPAIVAGGVMAASRRGREGRGGRRKAGTFLTEESSSNNRGTCALGDRTRRDPSGWCGAIQGPLVARLVQPSSDPWASHSGTDGSTPERTRGRVHPGVQAGTGEGWRRRAVLLDPRHSRQRQCATGSGRHLDRPHPPCHAWWEGSPAHPIGRGCQRASAAAGRRVSPVAVYDRP